MENAAAFTISEFCVRNKISRAKFYIEQAAGRGPRVMHVGQKRLISREAELDWHRDREAAAQNAEPQAA
jgi:hypothetical protein